MAMDKPGPKPRPFECREDLFWYLVGLVATDGCLLESRKTVVVTAKSEEFLLKLRDALGLAVKIHKKKGGFNASISHDLVIKRVDLYRQLTETGLTPRKSATIGRLSVPDKGFLDFLRGVIDGDGCIRRWNHPTNGKEQWEIKIVGISRPFLCWLSETIERIWGVTGSFHIDLPRNSNHRTKYTLKYGKLAARSILAKCYYRDAFALDRKAKLAAECTNTWVGWSKSKTIENPETWTGWKYRHGYGGEEASRVLDGPIAGVLELARQRGLKSLRPKGHAGSTPAPGTN